MNNLKWDPVYLEHGGRAEVWEPPPVWFPVGNKKRRISKHLKRLGESLPVGKRGDHAHGMPILVEPIGVVIGSQGHAIHKRRKTFIEEPYHLRLRTGGFFNSYPY